jgi:tetratricopeptide (TPR) repeat protein
MNSYFLLAVLLGLAALGLALWEPLRRVAAALPDHLRLRTPAWLHLPRIAPRADAAAPPGELAFVGREAELQQLFDAINQPADDLGVVLVSGRPGSGKRALLEEFTRRARRAVPTARVGPLMNLTHPRDADAALGEIAAALERVGLDRFDRFRRKLDSYRAKRAGVETAAERRLGRAFQAGKTLAGTFLPPVAGKLIELGADEAAQTIQEQWLAPPELDGVVQAFADDLREALQPDPANPEAGAASGERKVAVLLFENLDVRPKDSDTQLIRETLLTALKDIRVRVLATVQGPTELKEGYSHLELKFFDREQTEKFARDQIGIDAANGELMADIWNQTQGSPQRLAILHRYFQRYPGERTEPALAESARDAVATEQARDLLASETESQQELIRAISPLRNFNSELVEAVFGALKITATEGQPPPARELLRAGRGPRWFTWDNRRWRFDDPASRQSILDEFRESDPGRCRAVHLAAARYHRHALDRMDGLTSIPPPDGQELGWLLAYQSAQPAVRRYADPEYVDHLAEWLYHSASAERERAFATAQDQVAEALFAERYAEAQELLRAVSEPPLTPVQRTRVRLLVQLSSALAGEDYDEADVALRELDQLGGATPLLRAFECWHRGICEAQRDQLATAIQSFELARARLDKQTLDARTLRIACYNATWLAYSKAKLTGESAGAIGILDQQISRLAPASPSPENSVPPMPELLAELQRARALIHEIIGAEEETVLQAYLGALQALEETDAPEQRARVKLDLGSFHRSRKMYDDALSCLKEAESGFRLLAVESGVQDSLLEQMRLRLAQKNVAEADRIAKAIPRADSDAGLQLRIGDIYADSGEMSPAEAAYQRAVQLRPADARAHKRRTDALVALMEYESAVEALAEWSRVAGLAVEEYLDRQVFGRLDPTREVAILERAVETFPERVELRIRLGGRLWAESRDAEAKRQFEQAKAILADGDPPLGGQPATQASVIRSVRRHLLERMEDGMREHVLRFLVPLFDQYVGLRLELFEVLWRLASGAGTVDQRVPANDWSESEQVTGEHLLTNPAGTDTEVSAATHGFELNALERLRLSGRPSPGAEPAIPLLQETRRPATPVVARDVERDCRREAIQLLSDACTQLAQMPVGDREASGYDLAGWRVRLAEALVEVEDWTRAEAEAVQALAESPANTKAQQLIDRILFRRSWARVGQAEERPPIVVEVAADLERWVGETPEGQTLIREMLPALRQGLRERIGITIPGVRVRVGRELSPGRIVILIREIPCFATVLEAEYLATADSDGAPPPGWKATRLPWDTRREAYWHGSGFTSDLPPDTVVWDVRGVVLACLAPVLIDHAADLLSVEDVAKLVAGMPKETGAQSMDLSRLTAVLRALLRERVPITTPGAIVRALVEAPPDAPLTDVIEDARRLIVPDLLRPLLDREGKLLALDASPSLEAKLADAVRVETLGRWRYALLEPQQAQEVLSALRAELSERPVRAFVIADGRLRAPVHALTEFEFPELAVLTAAEAAGVPRA